MKYNSIRFKVSILHTIFLGVVLIAYSSFLYFSLYSTLYYSLDKELDRKITAIRTNILKYQHIFPGEMEPFVFAIRRTVTLKGGFQGNRSGVSDSQKKHIINLENEWLKQYNKLNLNEDFVHIVNVSGQTITKSRNLNNELRVQFLRSLQQSRDGQTYYKKLKFNNGNLRLLQTPLFPDTKLPYVIQIGTSQKPIIDLLEKRQMVIVWSIPVVLLLTFFIGRFLSAQILDPVADIVRTAKGISHEDLSRRIEVRNSNSEIEELSSAFNEMIARLEKSFAHIGQFSSQVAHELKTPLAIIQGECELALRKGRSSREYQSALQVNLDETGRMLRTIDDLLLLAKLDYRPEFFKLERFNFVEFISEVYEQSKILAYKKSINVSLDMLRKQLFVKGDKFHLRRLFFNIIHNAIKFTPSEGQIHLGVSVVNSEVITEISDTGIGIPAADLSRIFDMFYHGDHKAGREDISHGLGLSIARSIVKIHRGHIDVQSREGRGSTFAVALPICSLI